MKPMARIAAKKSRRKRARSESAASYLVFISHASHDLWIARQIAKEVTALGAQPWLDERDLSGGDVITEEIIRGIRACKEAIVVISPKSAKSQWVAFEIGAVAVQRKRVTPILNNVSHEAMAPVKGVKAINLNDFDDFLIQLKGRIKQRSKG